MVLNVFKQTLRFLLALLEVTHIWFNTVCSSHFAVLHHLDNCVTSLSYMLIVTVRTIGLHSGIWVFTERRHLY